MKRLRKKLIEWLFDKSQKVYTNMFKNHEPWGIYRAELLTYPEVTLGNHLGRFLEKNNFELIAKVERHDAYHTLTGYGTQVEDEIALQCLCFGNGKRSLYLYGAIILGVLILPDYLRYYYHSYQIGKNANSFHHYDYKKLLNVNIHDFRSAIFSSSQRCCPKKKPMKYIKIITLIITFLGISTLLTSFWIDIKAKGKTYDSVTDISKNKVGLVLGTAKSLTNGSENLYYTYRINATVALYEAGKIEFILISGDNGSKTYDEPSAFKNDFVKKGIPEERIFLDYAGFRTLDSVIRAKEIFGQTSITIISQKFHNERAIYLAENNGINAIGFNAKDVTGKYGLKTRLREYLARVNASLDVMLHTNPKFLGKKIEIK